MARLLIARLTSPTANPVIAKFFAGLALVNVAGAAACYIIATKYPEESLSAALWGMGAIIGYLMISIQAMHVLAPVQNGATGIIGATASGVLALNMAGWLLGVALSMGATDGPALLEDFKLIAGGVWKWARGLFA